MADLSVKEQNFKAIHDFLERTDKYYKELTPDELGELVAVTVLRRPCASSWNIHVWVAGRHNLLLIIPIESLQPNHSYFSLLHWLPAYIFDSGLIILIFYIEYEHRYSTTKTTRGWVTFNFPGIRIIKFVITELDQSINH